MSSYLRILVPRLLLRGKKADKQFVEEILYWNGLDRIIYRIKYG